MSASGIKDFSTGGLWSINKVQGWPLQWILLCCWQLGQAGLGSGHQLCLKGQQQLSSLKGVPMSLSEAAPMLASHAARPALSSLCRLTISAYVKRRLGQPSGLEQQCPVCHELLPAAAKHRGEIICCASCGVHHHHAACLPPAVCPICMRAPVSHFVSHYSTGPQSSASRCHHVCEAQCGH